METNQSKMTPRWIKDNVPPEIYESKIFRIQFNLDNKVMAVDTLQSVDINYELLESELENNPAVYVYYASIYSELKSQVAAKDVMIKRQRGIITNSILTKYNQAGIKLTDKQLTTLLEGDEQLSKLELELALLQKNVGKLWHLIEAVQMKSEHLRSLAGFKKQEREQSARQT